MELAKIMQKQQAFDSQHAGRFEWAASACDNLEMLKFLVISLSGEVGELAGIVKKIDRGDYPLDDVGSQISEEVADIFIYLIKLCNQMDIDLEQAYLSKMEKNRDRFRRYEKTRDDYSSEDSIGALNDGAIKLLFNTMKSKSEDDIQTLLSRMATGLCDVPDLRDHLQDYLRSVGLAIGGEREHSLFAAVLLAFVLADVATVPAKESRRSYIEVLQSVSERLNISYEFAVNLSAHTSRLYDLLLPNIHAVLAGSSDLDKELE